MTRPSRSPAADGSVCTAKKLISARSSGGQAVGLKEVEEGIWLVSFMDYDLGYVDLEERTLQPLGETTKRFTPKNEQANISHELRKIFMYFFITNLFGVVAAAI